MGRALPRGIRIILYRPPAWALLLLLNEAIADIDLQMFNDNPGMMGEKETSLTVAHTGSKTSAQHQAASPASQTQDFQPTQPKTNKSLSVTPQRPYRGTTTTTQDTEISNNQSNHNNGSLAVAIDQHAINRMPDIHMSRSDGTFNQSQSGTTISEARCMCWIFIGLLYFTLAWKYTIGGYRCSLLLFPLFLVHTMTSHSSVKRHPLIFVKYLFGNIMDNVKYILQMEWKPLILLLAYTVTKVVLYLFHPKLERSNGSPMSLILFTVYFIAIFILPSLVKAAWTATTCIIKFLRCRHRLHRMWSLINGRFFHPITGWKRCIMLTVIAVALSYIFDGDLTSILRYFGRGKSCLPLLIPRSLRDSLPYPLQHAWFKEWHHIFGNYKPSDFVKEMIYLGREMEVIHLLPVLIGVFVLSQVFLPRENWIVKKVLFGCISGVVLSGVTSGALKILLHRYRPNAYGNPYMWTGPSTTTVNHLAFSKLDLSFPCGHTSVSTSIATCLYYGVIYCLQMSMQCTPSLRFKIFLVMSVFSYPLLVLISRVSECYHWTSDAIFGVSQMHETQDKCNCDLQQLIKVLICT